MKIIYIANIRIPTEKAHGRQIMEMCSAFSSLGVKLDLVVPARKNKLLNKENIFKYYNLENNFTVNKLRIIDPVFLMRLPFGVYIKIQSLFFIFRLFFYILFLKNRKDLIFYTRDEYLLPFLNIFSKNVYWECHNLPKKSFLYLKYWKKCAGIVSISGGLKNELVGMGLDADRISVSSDGVNLKKFTNIKTDKKEIRKKFNLPIDKKIILYSGHLYDWKGAQVLADAARHLDNNIVVVFVGGSESDVKSFRQKNSSDNILILGHKPHEEIPYYLKTADVLVLPNSAKEKISSHYTSPLKLFEYMASGVPIIASDLSSIREVLNEDNAIFFEPDNAKNLAEKIKLILSDKQLADTIAKKSYADVFEYSWEKRAESIIKVIKL